MPYKEFKMKKLVALVAVLGALTIGGCSSPIGAEAAKGHKAVFGCWPQGYTPPRVLEAVGPKDDVKRDIFGNECGKPVYKRPACSEQPECADGSCTPPVKK